MHEAVKQFRRRSRTFRKTARRLRMPTPEFLSLTPRWGWQRGPSHGKLLGISLHAASAFHRQSYNVGAAISHGTEVRQLYMNMHPKETFSECQVKRIGKECCPERSTLKMRDVWSQSIKSNSPVLYLCSTSGLEHTEFLSFFCARSYEHLGSTRCVFNRAWVTLATSSKSRSWTMECTWIENFKKLSIKHSMSSSAELTELNGSTYPRHPENTDGQEKFWEEALVLNFHVT